MSDILGWMLIVEDDEDDYLLLQDAFESAGVRVRLKWAKDGEEAIACLKDSQKTEASLPLLIILDLNMPKVDGRQVLKEVRSSSEYRHIPVIILTNSHSQQDAKSAYAMGANSFVRKPAGFHELEEFVRVFCKYWFFHSKLA